MNTLYGKIEVLWEKYHYLISICIGVFLGFLYFNGLIKNIRSSTGNVISFASIIIGINGLFLSLVISLKESPVFIRLRELIPSFETKLFISIRTQIYWGLMLVLTSIIINVLPKSPSKILSSVGVGVWFIFLFLMTLGSFYTIKLITDIIAKNNNLPPRNRRP
ncbi:hypothetical protein COJ46_02455 [Bacillus sp. AFS077874]|uniref:hypothetical protein n=1 Tax=Bacillus sp. AFS077874 TaxID=2033513 RepID=UPI000BF540C9|nr:hypothetical protein [Bacillus sp. AFS077874]PFM82691.1 hypothetical protein COJ46_02455 [Bacillus sp. AFS077874]